MEGIPALPERSISIPALRFLQFLENLLRESYLFRSIPALPGKSEPIPALRIPALPKSAQETMGWPVSKS